MTRSHILVAGGTMFFQAGSDKNITFQTLGTGKIFINDANVAGLPSKEEYDKYVAKLKILEENYEFLNPQVDKLFVDINKLQKTQTDVERTQNKLSNGLTDFENTKENISTTLESNKQSLNHAIVKILDLAMNLHFDACYFHPCLNGGTCIPKIGHQFMCLCTNYFEGDKCENDVNECSFINGTDLACKNGGSCENTRNGYKCNCQGKFHGPLCQYEQAVCSQSTKLCGPHGHCIPSSNSYSCRCETGFKVIDEKTNPTCVDIDECENNPCHPGVQCLNLDGSFQCNGCPKGYRIIGGQCHDINECEEHPNICAKHSKCINHHGSYECGECEAGYSGDSKKQCIKDDPCSQNTCPESATCIPTDHLLNSLYFCKCPEDQILYHNMCTPKIYMCDPSLCQNNGVAEVTFEFVHRCKCNCPVNYVGEKCEKASPCFPNPCNNGKCQIREDHSAVCICDPLYFGKNCEFLEGSHDNHLTADYGSFNYTSAFMNQIYFHRTFFVRNNENYILRINFTKFEDMQSTYSGPTDCETTLGKLTLYNGPDQFHPVFATFCGESGHRLAPKLNQNITIPVSNALLEFKGKSTDFAFNYEFVKRECGYTTEIVKPLVVPENTQNISCLWIIKAPKHEIVRINIPKIMMLSGNKFDCNQNNLEIHDGFYKDQLIAQICSNVNDTLTSYPSKGSYMTILFNSRFIPESNENDKIKGFSLKFNFERNVVNCDQKFENELETMEFGGTIKSPSFGVENYPPNSKCLWEIIGARKNETNDHLTIKLIFETFDVKSRDEKCKEDYIEMQTDMFGETSRYCNDKKPPYPVLIQNSNAFIEFYSDKLEEGQGLEIRFEVECLRKFTANNGSIQTWNFPNGGKRGKCIYIIEAPKHKYISLKFNNVYLNTVQNEEDCFNYNITDDEQNFVEFRGGWDHNRESNHKYYCKKNNFNDGGTMQFYSSKPLTITVSSDGSDNFKGLSFEYNIINFSCGGYFSNETSHTFESPHYPSLYPDKVNCDYHINAENWATIKLSFEDFDLGISGYQREDGSCQNDRVEVYEYNLDFKKDGKRLITYCHSGDKQPVKTNYKNMLIRLISNSEHPRAGWNDHQIPRGFKAKFEYLPHVDCEKHLTNPDGQIDFTKHDMKCVYHVNIAHGNKIIFDKLSGSCNMVIYDGATEDSDILGTSDLDQPKNLNLNELVTSTHRALVKVYGQNENCTLNYVSEAGCGKNIVGTIGGSITSPGWPNKGIMYGGCEWTIKVNDGNRIQFWVEEMDDISSVDESHPYYGFCMDRSSQLRIYESPRFQSEFIAQFCLKTSNSTPIVSKHNELNLKYHQKGRKVISGFSAKWRMKCDGIVLTDMFGAIQSPLYPALDFEDSCNWTIVAPIGNRITIKIHDINIPCQNSYLEVSNLKDIGSKKLCNSLESHELTSEHNILNLNYYSGSGGGQFSLSYLTVGCVGDIKTPQNIIIYQKDIDAMYQKFECHYKIIAPIGQKTKVTFNHYEYQTPKEKCVYPNNTDFEGIAVFSGFSNESGIPSQTICDRKPNPITSQFHESFIIMSFDVKRFQYSYELYLNATIEFIDAPEGCSHEYELTDDPITISTPNYPRSYPEGTKCDWQFNVQPGYHIKLILEDFSIVHSDITHFIQNDLSTDYSCKVHSGIAETAHGMLTIIEGNTIMDQICNNTNSKEYEIFSNRSLIIFQGVNRLRFVDKNHTENKIGFQLTARRVCGGVVDASFEEQTMYIEMRDVRTCNVTIRNTIGDGTKIFAKIASTEIFNNNKTSNARLNNFEIFDGNFPVSNGNLRVASDVTATSTENMLIKIDTSYRHLHAAIKYSLNDFSCSSKTITEKSEKIKIDLQDEKKDCEWTISTKPGSYVHFFVQALQLPQSENCESAFIEIRKNNKTGELIKRTCKFEPTDSTTFEEQALYVRLKYQPQETQNGGQFIAEFNKKAGAKGNEDTLPSVFTIPDFFSPYPIYYNFESKDRNKYLYFEISNLFLSESSYIDIFENVDSLENFEPAEPYKTVQINEHFTLPFSKATMMIKYGRNDDYQIKWKPIKKNSVFLDSIEQYSDCGEQMLEATWQWQYIESPVSDDYYEYYEDENGDYKEEFQYANNLHCLWNLNHPMFTGVMFRFEKMDLKNENACVEDFVTFESDNMEFGKEKYCQSNETYREIKKETANNFKIHFISDGEGTAKGFRLGYKLMCSSSQIIPIGADYEYQLENSPFTQNETVECNWNIQTESSRKIIAEVLESNIGNGNCTNDFVVSITTSIFEDHQEFCNLNDAENRTIISTSNYLLVGYQSSPMKNKTFKLKLYEKTTECPSEPFRINSEHPSRTIYSPEYPGSIPHSTECEYFIQAPTGQTITLNFVDLDLEREDPNDKDHDYLEVRDGPSKLSTLFGKYQGYHAPSYITSTGNWLYLRLHTNNKRLSQRFEIRAELGKCGGIMHVNERQNNTILKFPRDDKMLETPINCTWLIQSQNTHLIDYKVVSLWDRYKIYDKAQLLINDGNNTEIISRANYGRNLEFTRSSSNQLKITFTVEKFTTFITCTNRICGFTMEFRLSEEKCGGIINNDSGTITLPGYPGNILPNLDCRYVFNAGVGFVYQFNFKYTVEQNNEPECNKFLRLYNTLEMDTFYGGEMFCKNSAVLTTRTDNGFLRYSDNSFYSRRTTSEPFVIEYQKIPMRIEENHCTYLVEKNETHSWNNVDGNTTKRGYQDFCHFKMKKSNGTMTLKINFSQVNQTYPFLQNDYIRLKSSKGPILYNDYFSGKTQQINQTEFFTLNNEMDLYIGQKTTSFLNFTVKIDVEFQDCGGYLKDTDSGYITSPNYGLRKVYLANSRCQWVLEAPIGQRIAIKIEEMDIHNTEDCKEDRLTVGEGKESHINVLHYYCQTDRNNTYESNRKSDDFDELYRSIVSKSRYLTLQWVTNEKTERLGWKLSYRFINEDDVCIYHEPPHERGVINFVRDFGDYLPNQQCSWDIQAPAGHHILLHYKFFHIESSEDCKNDHLSIAQKSHIRKPFEYFEMISLETNLKVGKPMCGEITPPDFVSETSRLVVAFQSNNKIEKSGFIIEWEAVCGATFNSSQGTITSPHFSNGYLNENRECEYIINAEKTDIVSIAFMEIDLMPKNNDDENVECGSDYIQIINSDNIGEKFCKPYEKMKKYYGPVRIIFKTEKNKRQGVMKKYKGFKITFSKYECGGNVHLEKDETKVIESGYKVFNDMSWCTWNISTTAGNILIAKIEKLTTFSNFVKYFDSFEKTKLIENLSRKSKVRRRVRTITPELAVELVSYSSNIGMVMSVTSKKLCYQSLNATEEIQTIIRPRDDNGDFVKLPDCVWIISAPEHSVIRINITNPFKDQVSSNTSKCISKGLAVYDGEFENSPLLTRKICHSPNHELVSSQQFVRVSFISHDNIIEDDFIISYALEPKGCNEELIAEEHIQNFTSTFSNNENDLRFTKRCTINIRTHKNAALTINFQNVTLSSNPDNNYLLIEDLGETITRHNGGSRRYTQNNKIQEYHSNTNYVKITVVTEKNQQSVVDFTYELFDNCQHYLESNKMDFAIIQNIAELENGTCETKIGNFENPVESSKIFIYGQIHAQKTGQKNSFFKIVDNSKIVEEFHNDEIISYVSEGNGFVELIRNGDYGSNFFGGFQKIELDTNDTLILKETSSMWGLFTYKNTSKYTTQISTIRPPNGYLGIILINILEIGLPFGDNCHTQDEYLKIEITDKHSEVFRNCPEDNERRIYFERGEDTVIKITLKIDKNITNVDRKVELVWNLSEHDY